MAQGTAPPIPPPLPPGDSPPPGPDEHQQFIEAQLRKTKRQVKRVDLAGGLLVLVVGTLLYLLACVVLDHWIVPGGLGFGARIILLSLLVVMATGYTAWILAPALFGRVNPVYAAYTIEQSEPTLKNSLINFLLLRQRREGVAPVVFDAIEERAASDLTRISVDAAVDRSRLVKLGYGLVALLAIGCLYKVLSPKDPVTSIERVIAPWASVAAPTRVEITEVTPGDHRDFHDARITVSALVRGETESEPVTLHFSTLDGQIIDRPLTMHVATGDYRYRAELPDTSGGLQQDLEYWITAGDAATPHYRVAVMATPTLTIDSVEYKYPDYSEMGSRRVPRRGDLQALEGTQVTLHATASHDIKDAYVDFGGDGRRDLRMNVQGRQATATFPLRLKPGTNDPEHGRYQLLLTTTDGYDNPKPIEHKIDVVADLPPTVKFVQPEVEPSKEQPLSASGGLNLVLEAQDPDYKVAKLTLMTERNGQPLASESLLPEPRGGKVRVSHVFQASRHKLKAGDKVVYWGVAEDNKQPGPHRVETPKYTLRIVSPQDAPQDQLAQNEPQNQPGQPPNQPQDGKSPSKQSQPGEGKQEQGQQEGQKGEGQKGEGNQGNGQQDEGQQGEGQSGEGKQAGEQPGEGKQQADGKQADKQDGGKSGNGQQDPAQKGDAQSGEQQQPGEQSQDGKQPDGKQANPQQGNGSQQAGSGGQGQQQPNDQAGEQGKDSESADDKPELGESPAGGQQRPGGNKKSNGPQQNGQPPADGQPSSEPDGNSGNGSSQPGKSSQTADKQKPSPDQLASKPQEQPHRRIDPESNPGEAIEQINKFFDERQKDQPENGGKPQPGDKSDPQNKPSPSSAKSDKNAKPDKNTRGQGSGSPQPGKGDQTQDGSQPNAGAGQKGEKPDKQPGQQPGAQGGDREGAKGEGGDGKSSSDTRGAPSSQADANPRDKQPGQAPPSQDQAPPDSENGKSPSNSHHESDAKGETSGDRSGGGEEGGGQKADQQGTGGPGKNTSAEEGGAASQEKGDSATSNRAGDKAQADGATGGKPGNKAGESGSQSRPGGNQPGGDQASQGGQQPGDQPAPDKSSPQQANAPAGGQQPGTGQPGDQQVFGRGQSTDMTPPAKWQTEDAGQSDPNLEYARKATELALERLKHELNKDEPDPELLKRGKWTRDDLEQIVKTWDERFRDAQAAGEKNPEAQQRLDELLRGLGLRPQGTTLKAGQVTGDTQKNMREQFRSEPPAEYREQYRAFSKGLSKSRENP